MPGRGTGNERIYLPEGKKDRQDRQAINSIHRLILHIYILPNRFPDILTSCDLPKTDEMKEPTPLLLIGI